MDTRQLPKVELHLHLDCGLSYEVVSKIDPSISKETYLQEFIAPAKCIHLADFLTRAERKPFAFSADFDPNLDLCNKMYCWRNHFQCHRIM